MLDAKHIAIGAVLFASLLSNPAPADPAAAAIPPKAPAKASYDGRWVIDATTSSFFCPVKRKRLTAVMQGGQVIKLTGLPGKASGRVGDDGAVAINVYVFGVTATVRGRLTEAGGVGDWSSNSILCARGGWRAAQPGN